MDSDAKHPAGDDPRAPAPFEIKANTAPILAVTVFKDRAEVIREVECELAPGESKEIVVKGLSDWVVTDSIRVNGVGRFTIHEVQYDKEWVLPAEGDKGDKASANEKLENLQRQEQEIRMELTRIDKEKALVQKYANTVTCSTAPSPSGAGGTFADLKTVVGVFDFYNERMKSLDDRQRATNQKLSKLLKKIRKATDEKQKLANRSSQGYYSHDVHIILQAAAVEEDEKHKNTKKEKDENKTKSPQSTSVRLMLVYTVTGATWEPSYDCRVEGKSDTMTIIYFGLVTQTTGEDWENVKLRLSTATPAVGGKPPSIPTKTVGWAVQAINRYQNIRSSSQVRKEAYFAGAPTQNIHVQQNFMRMDDAFLERKKGDEMAPAASIATASVKEGFATQFLIQRPATILSGRKPHKICIGVAPLAMKSMFYAVPAIAPRAYYQARAKNTSQYPFLASQKVRCFFDGNYVCNTDIKDVISPGEFFSTFVGVDDAIKITHKLVKGTQRLEGGLLSQKKAVQEHKSVTTIKNNKNSPIRISMALQLPKSLIHDIKVQLVEPSSDEMEEHTEPSEGAAAEENWDRKRVRFNPLTNNVVWLLHIQPGKSAKVPFQYEIRYPQHKGSISISSN